MPSPIPIPKHSPWVSQILVIRALLNREIVTRFGKYRLGFFWMLFEPLLGVIVIGTIIGTLAERTVPEINYSFFILMGFMQLHLFTGCMSSGINALGANQGLLVYPNVKPLDPFIARFIFQLFSTLFSFSLFCVVGMLMGIELSLARLHVLLACFLLIWFCSCGLGLIFGVAAAHYNEIEKIVGVLQRPLLFVSAVLIPLSALSMDVQKILLFNPLVHTIEVGRNALFPFYPVQGVDLSYPAVFAIIVLSIGLTLFHNSRNFLSQR